MLKVRVVPTLQIAQKKNGRPAAATGPCGSAVPLPGFASLLGHHLTSVIIIAHGLLRGDEVIMDAVLSSTDAAKLCHGSEAGPSVFGICSSAAARAARQM